MDDKYIGIILSVLFFFLIIIDSYLFFLTKINFDLLNTINLFPLIELLVSIEFILFIVFCCFTFALIPLIMSFLERKNSIIILTLIYFFGTLIGCYLFNLIDFFIPLLFGLIGLNIPLIWYKKEQTQKKQYFKSATNKIGKIIVFIALGFFLTSLITTINNENYKQEFIDDFMELTINEEESLKDNIQKPLIDSIINSQIQTIKSIKTIPGFSELRNKNDSDVLTFVTGFEILESTINSKQHIEEVTKNYEKQTQNTNIEEELLKQIPFIEKASNYAWLIYSLMLFILINFIGNTLIKNIGGVIYFLVKTSLQPN
jgi:hypothetical protein